MDGHHAGDDCPICLSEFLVGEETKRLRCGHSFHVECINQWILKGHGWQTTLPSCPMCKAVPHDPPGQPSAAQPRGVLGRLRVLRPTVRGRGAVSIELPTFF